MEKCWENLREHKGTFIKDGLELLENFSENFQSAMSFLRFGWFHGMPYVKHILEFLVPEKTGSSGGASQASQMEHPLEWSANVCN